jgi:carbonic anhydrase
MVIACCDARLDVSAIFDAEPSALFILRNVANLVPS